MIRRISITKAILGGVAGAAAWEAVARIAVLAGLEPFDIVRTLGTALPGTDTSPLYWWPLGLAVHCAVGAVWATFYAYFFWSMLDRRPWVQGMFFSLLPAILAGLIMVPEIDVMLENGGRFGAFARHLGAGGPAMIVAGHLVYGAVLGAIYVRPVGYRTGRPIRISV